MRTCSKCQAILPLASFHKNSAGRGGLRPDCKDCVRSRRKAYYYANAEKAREYSRSYHQSHPIQTAEYQRRYAAKKKFHIRERAKKWRDANNPKLVVTKRADYETNRGRYIANARAYQKSNPGLGRPGHHARRAKRWGVEGRFTFKDIVAKFTYFGWQCYLCGTSGTIKTLEVDHRTPMSRGGSNWIANVAPACHRCNQAKKERTEKEYRAAMKPP